MPEHTGECCACVAPLETRRDELLVFIRKLSNDAHNPEEVAELRRWVAVLMAAVGTLRAKLEPSLSELPRCIYCGSVSVYGKDGSLDVWTVNEITACAHCGSYQENGPPIPFGSERTP